MDNCPRYLEYGEQCILPSRAKVFSAGDAIDAAPIFYLVAGLVKLEYPVAEGPPFTLWVHPDTLFGLVEPLSECGRLCTAHAMERTILYRWDLESFFTAAGVSWELALAATTGMTRELRIMNAEFGQRLGAREGGA